MAIETILGTNAKLVLVSQTHGSVRVPLNQNFDYTPRFTAKTIFEFDRLDAALSIALFEGVDVKFEYLDSDSKKVDAMVNDLNPAASIIVDDPSIYRTLNIYVNIKNSLGKIFQSVLAKGVTIKGSATTEPVRDESRITRDGEALNIQRIKGGAIEYSRALKSGSTAFPQGSANDGVDKAWTIGTGNCTYTLSNDAQVISGTNKVLLALVNGTDNSELDSPYAISITTDVVTITPCLSNNDVIELFTVYTPA